ncbi:cupin domain-containing protein [Nesterenkonia sp. HG001]|uniref:cupin domain-containing protein n=1 Tax=Nesterenkonia sp. HG001 TaxID=2983207 RepID=UPI002AC7B983|nr:cupin domain-containing protein [Nesterenkonia sp. HG001]MDZ5076891.1 cupin domain-containing protein [Nesterenkonia sp. HG001]
MSAAHQSSAKPSRSLPDFPGGTSVSDLCVYDWDTPDGLHGGTPHLHTLSTEAYVVTAGRGEVHTLSSAGAARDDLEKGSLLWFTPGTVHRLVNHAGLELSVIMQNAGLPEAGDAVMTFPDEILADPERYRRAVALPSEGDEQARAEAARTRRDLAIEGYRTLLAAVEREGPAALQRLHARAVELVRPRLDEWRRIWAATVEAETERTRVQMDALAEGDGAHLSEASVIRGTPRPEPRLFGMCGRLQVWSAPETLVDRQSPR